MNTRKTTPELLVERDSVSSSTGQCGFVLKKMEKWKPHATFPSGVDTHPLFISWQKKGNMKKKKKPLFVFPLGTRLARNDGASEANIGNSGSVLPTKKNGRGHLLTASV